MKQTEILRGWNLVGLIGALMLAMILGYTLGRLVSIRVMVDAAAPVTFSRDERSSASVIVLEGIRNGELTGGVIGDVRVFLGNEQIFPDEDGAFAVPAGPLLTNEIFIEVPAGMRFVASRRGKKYYPVAGAAGEQIVPENRVYFATEEEAKKAGYSP